MKRKWMGIAAGWLLGVFLLCGASVSAAEEQGTAVDTEAVRAYADPIVESILTAMNEDNYKKYGEFFDKQMRTAISEPVFYAANPVIKGRIGQYVSKEFVSAEAQEQYTVVMYKAHFSQEPDGVSVKCVLSEGNGKRYVSGLWLDSPLLRGK